MIDHINANGEENQLTGRFAVYPARYIPLANFVPGFSDSGAELRTAI